jgi:post-segregation antitoxin (ccd killing protein)
VEEYALDTKSNVTIYLNADLANLGKEMGLNLSKVCENALKTAINRLQGFNVQNNDEQQQINALSSSEWTGRDLNPRLPRCERGGQAFFTKNY